jgi:hypothetical protein
MSVQVPRIEPDRGAVLGNGLRPPAELRQDIAQVVVGLRIGRQGLEDPLELRDRFQGAARTVERDAKAVSCVDVARLEAQGGLKLRNRLGEPPLNPRQGEPKVNVHARIVRIARIDPERGLQVPDALRQPARRIHEGPSQVCMGLGHPGIKPERRLELGDRLGRAAGNLREGIPKVVMGVRLVGLESHGLPQVGDRLRRQALFRQVCAEVVVGHPAFRVLGQGVGIKDADIAVQLALRPGQHEENGEQCGPRRREGARHGPLPRAVPGLNEAPGKSGRAPGHQRDRPEAREILPMIGHVGEDERVDI